MHLLCLSKCCVDHWIVQEHARILHDFLAYDMKQNQGCMSSVAQQLVEELLDLAKAAYASTAGGVQRDKEAHE